MDRYNERNLQVGDIVYEPYKPNKYGKILAIKQDPSSSRAEYPIYTVKWKDGTQSDIDCFYINSLKKLIESHEKKLNTHKKALVKAKAL